MKRLFVIASLAILAVGCQKTEIQNEVQTPIGFSTEVGKQTRAIVATSFDQTQPFGVYAYGYDNGVPNRLPVMKNVEIAKIEDAKWGATGIVKYYWPNNANSTLNFYAYSPYIGSNIDFSGNTKTHPAHQKMPATLNHDETAGLRISGYTHTNMYVDFMVATPVIGAKYGDQSGDAGEGATVVPAVLHHEMTQIVFKVNTAKAYDGVTFTVKNITLNNIGKAGAYVNPMVKTSSFASGTWTTTDYTGSYQIFPQTAYDESAAENGCPTSGFTTQTTADVDNATKTLITEGVTMLPQTIEEDKQSFTITYSIAGDGVAEETVTRTVEFADFNPKNAAGENQTLVSWANNQKITYSVRIGLNEIYFNPTVVDWTTADGNEYTFQQ